ncbi:hypothetical protein DLAC_11097 [Tieghemostelium lacteum]|uniref:Uncharacterized protein n=1 Tax=Tieghemostelium lacteum TaxID=361077 RepID=A0A151Z373_TIELA|nr:hypothetical protein DLAC_11097 [Tieghemostelium lacteum]|eukprot:KYQ88399.1 hypothetical protein DLAC_11097 [Tieghemostelium lacteum]
MGRSKAKNTKQPSLDFKIKKRKLGKKPLPNPNLTLTTFKSKVLHLPGQSIVEDKEDIVNYRNQTLKDLLTKCSHYNDTVKKDAVNGIKDLVCQFPKVLHQHLGAIMGKVVEVINDLDKDVRASTHQLINVILPLLDEVSISPFIPLFSVYIASGMTHLKTHIRLDSLRLLDIFIDRFPKLLSHHCHQMIPNYLDLLKRVAVSTQTNNTGTSTSQQSSQNKKKILTSATPKANSINTRVFILGSLYKLLQVLLKKPDLSYASLLEQIQHKQIHNQSLSCVNITSPFENYTSKLIFSNLFTQQQSSFTSTNSMASTTTSSTATQEDADKIKPTILETKEELYQFTRVFMKVLIECWLELVPSNPMISYNTLEDLQLVLNIINLTVHCLKTSYSSSTTEMKLLRKDFLKYFTVHYPFSIGSAQNPDSKEWIISSSLNSTMTQIFAHFLELKPGQPLDNWFTPCLEYIEGSLLGNLIDEKNEARQGHSIRLHISNYLWVLKLILPVVPQEKCKILLNAFIKFDESCHSHSSAKKACVFFISELIEIQSDLLRKDNKTLAAAFKEVVDWGLESLPKLLWSLGNSDHDTSLMIINILLHVGRDISKQKQFESIQNALVPYFFTITKPNSQHPNGRQIYGPFLSVPIHIQCQALNLLYYFKSLTKTMIRSLIAILRSPKCSYQVLDYILDLLQKKVSDIGIDHYLAFCVAILLSITTTETSTASDPNLKRKREEREEIINLESQQEQQIQADIEKQKKQHDLLTLVTKDKIIKKLCWNINTIRLNLHLSDLLEPIKVPLLNEIERILKETTINHYKLNYLIQIINSCLTTGQGSNDWSTLPNEFKEVLPKLVYNYLTESISLKSTTLPDYIIDYDSIISLFTIENGNTLINQLLILLKGIY